MNLGIVQIAPDSPLSINGVKIASGARAHSMAVEHKASQRPALVFDLQRLYVEDIFVDIVYATIVFADKLQ